MVVLLPLPLVLASGPSLPAPQAATPLPALVTDHPAAKACAARPDKCTCAISRPVACIDTPAGKTKLAACVRTLLRQYGGRRRH